jgi:hypothetical protein
MSLTAPPTAPSTADPSTFSSRMDAMIAWMATNVSEMNAFQAALNAIAAGGAMAIPYTFSTTTTDADPGAGTLRLDNATQNIATTIRADLAGADGSTWTDVLNTFDDSTSTVKGCVRLVKATDATKFLIFSVSALASPSGYKNITVAVVASSAASPFTNGDALIMYFTRTGDAGVASAIGDIETVLTTGNGHGAVNTKARRFTTTEKNTGSGWWTLADSANDGMSITIDQACTVIVEYTDVSSGGGDAVFGISVNSNQLTLSIESITASHRKGIVNTQSGYYDTCTTPLQLAIGDVVRAHTAGAVNGAGATVRFCIRKIGGV